MMISDLWICPHCGRQFANPNQWHSCGRFTVGSHLDRATPIAKLLFEEFITLVQNCGETIIEATKTSIAFKSPGVFAVVHFQKKGIKVSFWLPRRIENHRFTRIEAISP
jgi:hypothetical protein